MVRAVESIIRMICMSALLLLCVGIFSMRVEAADKILQIDQNLINQVGNQTQNSSACGCFSMAYCRTILDGRVRYYTEFNNGGTSGYAIWSKANYTERTSTDKQAVFRNIIENIDAGSPVIVYCGYTGRYSSFDHYVAIVGYQNVTNINNLSSANFLMYDSGYIYNRTSAILESFNTSGMDLGLTGGHYRYFTTPDRIITDSTKPVISNVSISNVTATGYTVTCNVTDNVGVTSVKFPSWRVRDTSAGCTWFDPTSRNGNVYTFKLENLNCDDDYLTHIYAYDGAGNYACVAAPITHCGHVSIGIGIDSSKYDSVEEQTFEIQSVLNDNMVMDVELASKDDGANVQLYERNGTDAQRWKFIPVNENSDYYYIKNVNSGKVLSVKDAYSGAGANVRQKDLNDGGPAKQFKICLSKYGYYIVSKLGTVIDIYGGGTTNGTNINTQPFDYSEAGIKNRSWKFVEVVPERYIVIKDFILRGCFSCKQAKGFIVCPGAEENVKYSSFKVTTVAYKNGKEIKKETEFGPCEGKREELVQYYLVKPRDFDNAEGEYTTTITLIDDNGFECKRVLKYNFNDYPDATYKKIKIGETVDFENVAMRLKEEIVYDTGEVKLDHVNNQYSITGIKAGRVYIENYANYRMIIVDIINPSFEYSISDDGLNSTIVKYVGNEKVVTIPYDIEDAKVTSISEGAFADCESIESIVVPDNLVSVDWEKIAYKKQKGTDGKFTIHSISVKTMSGEVLQQGEMIHEHSYTEKVIAPTYTEDGYTLHTCDICGDSYKDSIVEKLSHSENGNINLSAQVSEDKIQFSWNVPDKTAAYGIVYALDEQELDIAEANNGYEVSGLKASSGTMTYDCPTTVYENQPGGVWFRVVMKNGDEVKHSNAVQITNWSDSNPNETTGGDPSNIPGEKSGDGQGDKQGNNPSDTPSGKDSGTDDSSQNSNNTDSNLTNSEKITLSALTVTKATPSTNQITFTWSGDASATGYEIEYSVNADLSNPQKAYWNKHSLKYYRLTDLNENTTYYYRLRAYKGEGAEREYSEWTSVASVQTKPKDVTTESPAKQTYSAPKITLKSVKNNKKKTIVVKWKWNVKADGYQISYAKKKNFSGAKKKNVNAYKDSVTIKNLTKGKTYYVKIRSFVMDDAGNKVYGKWSSVKKVKIKK